MYRRPVTPVDRERRRQRERERRARMSEEQKARELQRLEGLAKDESRKRLNRWGRDHGEAYLPFHERPFVGVDGEGGHWFRTDRHEYGALIAGSRVLRTDGGAPLTTLQCLDFLTSLPRMARYVSFFFDYDNCHILRRLPEVVLRAVMDPSKKHPDVHFQPRSGMVVWHPRGTKLEYGIRYIPRRLLTLCRFGTPKRDEHGNFMYDSRGRKLRHNDRRRVTIYDAFGYFQKSFVSALEDWKVGTVEEMGQVATWKHRRAGFTLPISDDVVEYSKLEGKLLGQLMTKVEDACGDAGITLKKYNGAGTIAEALLAKHDITAYLPPQGHPEELRDHLRRAYFGGRFEVSARGRVDTLYEYDIASAYPAAMLALPCLAHGAWRKARRSSKIHSTGMYHVTWNVPDGADWGPFPWRDWQGGLWYPLQGEGWYWGDEVRAAINLYGGGVYGGAITILEGWVWFQKCDHRPFTWVADVYTERLRRGKEEAGGRILKLGLNSLYGKLAQTVGGGSKYSDWAWAGMITAGTRAKLLQLAAVAGHDGVMMETDALFSRVPLHVEHEPHPEFPGKPALGSWEHDETSVHRDVLIVQGGVYFTGRAEAHSRDRSRGISGKLLAATHGIERLYQAWDEDGINAKVTLGPRQVPPPPGLGPLGMLRLGVPLKPDIPMQHLGHSTALQRGKPGLAGTWVPIEKTVNFHPTTRHVGEREGGLVRTTPVRRTSRDGHILDRLSAGMLLPTGLSSPYAKMKDRDFDVAKMTEFEQPDP